MILSVVYAVVAIISIALTIYNMIAAASYKPPEPPIPSPKDLGKMPTAEQGKPIPVLFGSGWIEQPNVVWWGSPHSRPNRVSSSELQ